MVKHRTSKREKELRPTYSRDRLPRHCCKLATRKCMCKHAISHFSGPGTLCCLSNIQPRDHAWHLVLLYVIPTATRLVGITLTSQGISMEIMYRGLGRLHHDQLMYR